MQLYLMHSKEQKSPNLVVKVINAESVQFLGVLHAIFTETTSTNALWTVTV